MNRRHFLGSSALLGLGTSFSSLYAIDSIDESVRESFSQNGNQFTIYTKAKVKPIRVFHITDTHLSLDDKRGEKYASYSKRMAGAYKLNKHFKTQEELTTRQSFELTLELAQKQKVDFLALTGDIFSFPSVAAVEWAREQLDAANIPFAFVAGNHDWHYEGMEGTANQLRETWLEKHLSPMYQGSNPLFSSQVHNGVRFVCIDNSTYEILPEQLEYFKSISEKKEPMVLLMHIPLYLPGRNMSYGCGHPDWNAKNDRNYELERREPWRKNGHTKVTMDFCKEVFNAPNLLAILAGHSHKSAIDVKNGIPQIVSAHNATAYYADINIKPV